MFSKISKKILFCFFLLSKVSSVAFADANANPLQFGAISIKKTDLERTLNNTSPASSDLKNHPYSSEASTYTKDESQCFATIQDAIAYEKELCEKSNSCGDHYFVVLPCYKDYDTADSMHWNQLKDSLISHYNTYSTDNPFGKTEPLVRYRVFKWATQIWSTRTVLKLDQEKQSKLKTIKENLAQKFNLTGKAVTAQQVQQAEQLQKAIADYEKNSAPVKKIIHQYLETFKTHAKGLQDTVENINEKLDSVKTASGTDKKKTAFKRIGKKIDDLNAESQALQKFAETHSEELVKELETTISKFKEKTLQCKNVMPPDQVADLDRWEASLIEAVKDTKKYADRALQIVKKKNDELTALKKHEDSAHASEGEE